LPADLTAALNEMSLPSLGAAANSIGGAPVIAPLSAPAPSSCTYGGSATGYVCPDITVGGMTISRSFTLLDLAGASMPSYDKATTDGVRSVLSAVGTITSGGTTLNVNQQQQMTLSGLLSGVHKLNGFANTTVKQFLGSGASAVETMSSMQNLTVTNVVLPSSAPGASPYPASGTLAMDGATTLGIIPTVASRLVLTFNGTRSVPVSITVGGVTRQCTLDLAGQNGLVCG
jgi:hypothetical protein